MAKKPHKPRTKRAGVDAGVDPAETLRYNEELNQEIEGKRKAIADRLWEHLSDKPLPKAHAKTMLRDLFGTAKGPRARGNAPDTKAAADALGVSRRTVQRWITDNRLPNSPAGTHVREQWSTSKKARSRQVSAARKKALRAPTGNLSVELKGRFIVSSTDRWSNSDRTVNINTFSPQGRQQMLDSLLAGDSDGAYDALVNGVRDGFGGSAELAIDLNSIDIKW